MPLQWEGNPEPEGGKYRGGPVFCSYQLSFLQWLGMEKAFCRRSQKFMQDFVEQGGPYMITSDTKGYRYTQICVIVAK